jgi:RNA polymerase sigma factor (sigma-70 family)
VDTCYLPATRKCKSDSESQLVSRAKNGEEEAFAALFEAHKKRIYTLCWQMVGDVAEVEDLTQEAFIQAFRKLATFRGDSTFSTWLYRIAVNTVLMKLRLRRPQQISYDEPIWVNSSLATFMANTPGVGALRKASGVSVFCTAILCGGSSALAVPSEATKSALVWRNQGKTPWSVQQTQYCSPLRIRSNIHGMIS